MKSSSRLAATGFALIVGLGLAGAGAATPAHAAPGPFPQWCPGNFWDPAWGPNWDGNHCHENWHGPGSNPHPEPGHPGGPGGPH